MPASPTSQKIRFHSRASRLQCFHVASTSIVTLHRPAALPLLPSTRPPDTFQSPTSHSPRPRPIFPPSRAASVSPPSPASFLHQPPSPFPYEPSAPLDNPATTTLPRCCTIPTKKLTGTPPNLLAQTFPSGVTPVISPSNLRTRRTRCRSSSGSPLTARFLDAPAQSRDIERPNTSTTPPRTTSNEKGPILASTKRLSKFLSLLRGRLAEQNISLPSS